MRALDHFVLYGTGDGGLEKTAAAGDVWQGLGFHGTAMKKSETALQREINALTKLEDQLVQHQQNLAAQQTAAGRLGPGAASAHVTNTSAKIRDLERQIAERQRGIQGMGKQVGTVQARAALRKPGTWGHLMQTAETTAAKPSVWGKWVKPGLVGAGALGVGILGANLLLNRKQEPPVPEGSEAFTQIPQYTGGVA